MNEYLKTLKGMSYTAFVIRHTRAFDRADAETLPDACRRSYEDSAEWALLVVGAADAEAADKALDADSSVTHYEEYRVTPTTDHDAMDREIAKARGINR